MKIQKWCILRARKYQMLQTFIQYYDSEANYKYYNISEEDNQL